MSEKIAIEKLGNHNWQLWKFKIALILGEKGLSDIVKGAVPENPSAEWLKRDGVARSVIGLALEDTQLCHVMDKEHAKEMWDALELHHERKSVCGKVYLMRKMITMRLEDDGNMPNHLSELTLLFNRLSALGEKLVDHWMVAIMLSSLPESYNMIVMSLETRPEEELSLDFVKGRLLDEWRRRCEDVNRTEGESSKQKALATSAQKPAAKKCYYCGEEGHIRPDCPKRKADKERKKGEEKPVKKSGQNKKNQKVAQVESASNEICFGTMTLERDLWYFDSGCTSHMTGNVNSLDSIDNTHREVVSLADGKKVHSEGIGIGTLGATDGDGNLVKLTVKNVLHVPALKNSLLSISKITDEDCEVTFTKSGCSVVKDGKVVVTGGRIGNMYHLIRKESSLQVTANHQRDCRHLWHRRLGHRNPEDIDRIVNEELGTGLKLKDCCIRSVCTVCCKGKLARLSFPKQSQSKTKATLDLVHSDLCGPLEVATPRGSRYVLTLIDDFSRYCTIYLLERKSQAAEKIEEFIKLMKTQFGKVPKILRTDGGGEYSGESFKRLLKSHGILLQQTAPYSPQQNGRAERKNRSVIEMTRCLLLEANLEKRYWGEAVSTANYLLNLLPAAATGRTPYELWFDRKPSYKHLRVFGSPAYVHIPKERRKKLDDKSVKMIFVGYADGSKAYRFLDKSTNRVTVSRDAKFLEQEAGAETIREVVPEEVEIKLGPPSLEKEEESDTELDADLDWDEDVDVPENNEEELGEDSDDGTLEYDSATDFEGFEESEYLRRSQRANKGVPPVRLIEESNSVRVQEEFEPTTYKEAISCPNKEQWIKAMREELKSHCDLKTWDLVPPPVGRKIVGCRWVFKLKRDANGKPIKYKARLVAQGFSQQPGVDFDEVYAPVAKQATLRALLAVASSKELILEHMDVKTAYLNGELNEEVYMRQPPGFSKTGKQDLVCRIRKSIYGLRQSARCWNNRFDGALKQMKFKSSSADPCLYTRERNGKRVYVLLYVDDVVVGAQDKGEIDMVFNEFNKHFETTSLGELKHFLGLEVERDRGNYSVSLKGYIQQTAQRFGLGDAKSARTPMDESYGREDVTSEPLPNNTDYRSLVGALLYISVNARPDIAAATAVLGRKVTKPTEADWTAAKRVVRYLRGTIDRKLVFDGRSLVLSGYSDADWAGNHASRKSTSGFVFMLGGAAISWRSRQQNIVALSSMESEYVALSEAAQEATWLRRLLADLGIPQNQPTTVHEDNQSCIAFVRSERVSKRSKHIETKEMYVKDLCDKKMIQLEYLCSEDMIADSLTKPLGANKIAKFSEKMGLLGQRM